MSLLHERFWTGVFHSLYSPANPLGLNTQLPGTQSRRPGDVIYSIAVKRVLSLWSSFFYVARHDGEPMVMGVNVGDLAVVGHRFGSRDYVRRLWFLGSLLQPGDNIQQRTERLFLHVAHACLETRNLECMWCVGKVQRVEGLSVLEQHAVVWVLGQELRVRHEVQPIARGRARRLLVLHFVSRIFDHVPLRRIVADADRFLPEGANAEDIKPMVAFSYPPPLGCC